MNFQLEKRFKKIETSRQENQARRQEIQQQLEKGICNRTCSTFIEFNATIPLDSGGQKSQLFIYQDASYLLIEKF